MTRSRDDYTDEFTAPSERDREQAPDAREADRRDRNIHVSTGRVGTTMDEDYTGAATGTDPEEELLQPYSPRLGPEPDEPTPQATSGSRSEPGMPNQAGTLDQTTYTSGAGDDDSNSPLR